MADYIVYKHEQTGTLEPLVYEQVREEEWLLRPTNPVPGEDFVVISDAGTPERALAEAQAYFDGTHQASHKIKCWAAGARARRACLKQGQAAR